MNAKVNFQLPKQLIPFYSTADVIKAHSLAFETAKQLRTLVNQISKNTAFVKAYAEENKANSSIFTELENLIAVSHHLTDSQVDTYDLERKRYQKELNAQCSAGDLLDAYSLAFENTSWLQTMLYQIKDEAEIVKEAVKQNIHSAVFITLENLIHIAAYFAENHSNAFDVEREKYEMEWNKIGGDKND
ncbi:hypothetical protein [Acinetobacter sp. SA01]|uniref:hypothetical protein n=1 Tax=Acinetobacter sp. SA01 TaxID=1862567 RepID=UPI001408EE7C|nr:hypothetical protein [Acinetobacter sp. SA01]